MVRLPIARLRLPEDRVPHAPRRVKRAVQLGRLDPSYGVTLARCRRPLNSDDAGRRRYHVERGHFPTREEYRSAQRQQDCLARDTPVIRP
jgi:hypothetical protein